jgi:hypothetical protein
LTIALAAVARANTNAALKKAVLITVTIGVFSLSLLRLRRDITICPCQL